MKCECEQAACEHKGQCRNEATVKPKTIYIAVVTTTEAVLDLIQIIDGIFVWAVRVLIGLGLLFIIIWNYLRQQEKYRQQQERKP